MLPSKYKQKRKHSEKTNIFRPSDFLLFSLRCLHYLTNKFVFLDQFFSVPVMFVLEGLKAKRSDFHISPQSLLLLCHRMNVYTFRSREVSG